MVMSPSGLGPENDCAGEKQHQFPFYLVSVLFIVSVRAKFKITCDYHTFMLWCG
jgi:hypothetical protein